MGVNRYKVTKYLVDFLRPYVQDSQYGALHWNIPVPSETDRGTAWTVTFRNNGLGTETFGLYLSHKGEWDIVGGIQDEPVERYISPKPAFERFRQMVKEIPQRIAEAHETTSVLPQRSDISDLAS